jgi:hypothetical protein
MALTYTVYDPSHGWAENALGGVAKWSDRTEAEAFARRWARDPGADVTIYADVDDRCFMSGRWTTDMVIWTLTPTGITGIRVTDQPGYGRTASGYGGSIPTRYMAECLDSRERRIYMMQYGNGGTPYIRIDGVDALIENEIVLYPKGN